MFMQQPGTDSLTGLVNREAFNAALVHALASGKGFGLLLCDVDLLKLFSDVQGHVDGDASLLSAADALQSADAIQLAGRIGGDEFAALVQCERFDLGKVAEGAWLA